MAAWPDTTASRTRNDFYDDDEEDEEDEDDGLMADFTKNQFDSQADFTYQQRR